MRLLRRAPRLPTVDVYGPRGASRGVVALIHGGFWRPMYGREGLAEHCRDLAGRGFVAGNIGYRRIGEPGGGFPGTCEDVVAMLRRLAKAHGPLTAVVGHSAGGQLALWAAQEISPRPQVVVTVSGCNDLGYAEEQGLGNGAVRAFTGGSRAARRAADPMQRVPLGVRSVLVLPRDEPVAQRVLTTNYADAARAAGDDVVVAEVPGDHLSLLDTSSHAWAAVLAAVEAAASGAESTR